VILFFHNLWKSGVETRTAAFGKVFFGSEPAGERWGSVASFEFLDNFRNGGFK